MRHLEQIIEDKRKNDVALAAAQKRDAEIKTELEELRDAVEKEMR